MEKTDLTHFTLTFLDFKTAVTLKVIGKGRVPANSMVVHEFLWPACESLGQIKCLTGPYQPH